MGLLKSKRRRQAEEFVERLLEWQDEGRGAARRGRGKAGRGARKVLKTARHDAAAAREATLREARVVRREAARAGDNVSDLVQSHPGAAIGGALALAVVLGAGVTLWARRG